MNKSGDFLVAGPSTVNNNTLYDTIWCYTMLCHKMLTLLIIYISYYIMSYYIMSYYIMFILLYYVHIISYFTLNQYREWASFI